MKNTTKQAVILAGGLGTRLLPYTSIIPKPLMPVGIKSVLEILLKQFSEQNFDEIYLMLGYKSSLIKSYILDQKKKYKLKIFFFIESKPLSTIGPLKKIEKFLNNNFLLINGDTLTNLNFKKFYKYHLEKKNKITLCSSERSNKIDYGVIIKKNFKLVKFLEKPVTKLEVNTGIYVINKSLLKFIPKNKSYSFDKFIISLMKRKISINIYNHKGYWLDIGRHDDYLEANKAIKKSSL